MHNELSELSGPICALMNTECGLFYVRAYGCMIVPSLFFPPSILKCPLGMRCADDGSASASQPTHLSAYYPQVISLACILFPKRFQRGSTGSFLVREQNDDVVLQMPNAGGVHGFLS